MGMSAEISQPFDECQPQTNETAPTLSRPGLLVMDVDSTLIDEEVIDELGVIAGRGEQVTAITTRAMNGELDFLEALSARVGLLRGLPSTVFDQVYEHLHFTRGALELIGVLHRHGWKVGVVSGGFHEIVDKLVADAGIDFALANRLGVDGNGLLTGELNGEIVTKATKSQALHDWAERIGVPHEQTVAMGDGANDIPMIMEAGLGVAFCAKPATQAAAPHAINQRDLSLLLRLLRA